MTSRAIASLSAALLGLAGAILLFAGDVVANRLAPGAPPVVAVLAQLLGGAWLGLAALNWFTRGQAIGGIYGRPVVLSNLVAYFVSAATLLKATAWTSVDVMLVAGGVAAAMAAFYSWLLFRSPSGSR
jgi:hypothetical protein